ncbi:MAG: leucine-rich repeat domain-containing protein [Bacteroidaceae bacterium]|nr:leucine-rich repeat domain-containing protein [Bacteroidaceae bacterium]
MKKNRLQWASLFALVCGLTLTSCGGKQSGAGDGNGQEAAAGETVPEDAIYYSQADHAKWSEGKGQRVKIQKLAFNDKIQDAGDGEFAGNPNITDVYFAGKEFLNVGVGAFEACPNLENLHFVGNAIVDVFNDESFKGCPKLKKVDGHIKAIGLNAFDGCESLETVITYDDLSQVRGEAFANCPNLKTVILAMPLKDYKDGNTFKGSENIEEISIPHKVNRLLFSELKDSKNLKTVYLLAGEFYEFPDGAQGFPAEQVDLYVMDNLVETFKADAVWGKFKSIKPLSESQYFQANGLRK